MTTQLQDPYGNPLTTKMPDAVNAYAQGIHLFLGSNFGATACFETAIHADPAFALGHAARARSLAMDGRLVEAKAAIARAETLAKDADDRERSHISIHALMLAGKAAACRDAVFAHVRDHPRDVLVAQLCSSVFGLIGFSGKIGREAALLAYTETLLPHYDNDWWMLTMHAISLCETGQIARSHHVMDQALALNPRNANASHFKAHALYEDGEAQAGRAFLSDWIKGYDTRSALHGHLSWHEALWALEEGDTDHMWHAIDTRIGPDGSKGLPLNVLTDTVALLYRAEIAGHTVNTERWRKVSDYAAQFFPKTGQSFADLHAALGHAMAGDGDRLARIAERPSGFAGDLVEPVAKACQFISRQNWTEALVQLAKVMSTSERFGGSRAQRDLIELAYVYVLMKLGLKDEAKRALLTRRPVLATKSVVFGLA